ncbi:MAG: peptide chain release factor N(5)-glutamine methyltransferase [Planctomycetota bacterium]|jgi:release factor glutamine methyltransferase
MTDDKSAPWTILRLLNWTQEHFSRCEVDSPRLASEILLGYSLGCQRIELYTRFDHCPTADQLSAYRQLVKRAALGEPVAYLIGEKEFYSLQFKVTPDVLIPRPETELLVSAAVEHLLGLGRPGKLWDVCTGSGCVAVAIASQVPDVTVLASDISAKAISIARENVDAHQLAGRVQCRTADLLNLLKLPGEPNQFDVITANPPYVREGDEVAPSVRYEPPTALYAGKDGLDFIRPIIAGCPPFLTGGGILAIEFGYDQSDAVRDLIIAGGSFESPRILCDYQGIERAAVAKKRPR